MNERRLLDVMHPVKEKSGDYIYWDFKLLLLWLFITVWSWVSFPLFIKVSFFKTGAKVTMRQWRWEQRSVVFLKSIKNNRNTTPSFGKKKITYFTFWTKSMRELKSCNPVLQYFYNFLTPHTHCFVRQQSFHYDTRLYTITRSHQGWSTSQNGLMPRKEPSEAFLLRSQPNRVTPK